MIGYIGNESTLDYYAGTTFYVKDELIGYKTIGRLFHALEANEVTAILIPYETDKHGLLWDGIHRVIQFNYHIERQIVLDVQLSLIAKQPNIDKITELLMTYEDYQDAYLTIGNLKSLQTKTFVSSRYDAIKKITQDHQGAIVTNYDNHDYHTLKTNVRDYHQNSHTFLLIGQSLKTNGFHNRVMLYMTFDIMKKHSIYDTLHETVMQDITVDNLHCVPSTNQEEKSFVLTLNGNLEHDSLIQILTLLKQKAKHIQIIGSYYAK